MLANLSLISMFVYNVYPNLYLLSPLTNEIFYSNIFFHVKYLVFFFVPYLLSIVFTWKPIDYQIW